MEIWKITAITIGSVAMIFFTYLISITLVRIDESLTRWAAKNGYQILRRESPFHDHGPFYYNQYCPTYFITVEDQKHLQRTGWIRLGCWYIVFFNEHIEVKWID